MPQHYIGGQKIKSKNVAFLRGEPAQSLFAKKLGGRGERRSFLTNRPLVGSFKTGVMSGLR
jgi:hypothetical protein